MSSMGTSHPDLAGGTRGEAGIEIRRQCKKDAHDLIYFELISFHQAR